MANYRRRRASSWRMIAVAVAAIFVVVSIAAVLIVNTFLNKIDNDPEGFVETIPEIYDVPTESLVHEIPKEEGITNILLLGVDNRNSTVASPTERSDSMIILTIDEKNKKFKLKRRLEEWIALLDLDPSFVDTGAEPAALAVRCRKGQWGAHTDCGKALESLKASNP